MTGCILVDVEEEVRERLRRAIYRAEASDADRQRYALLTGDPEPAEVAVATPAPPRTRRPALLAFGLVAVAGLGLLVWPIAAGSTSAEPPATARPPVRASKQPDGRQAGIRYTDAGVVQEFHGGGATTALLDPGVMPRDGGRLSVVLTVTEPALVGWQVRRTVPVDGASDQLLAAHSATERRGVAVPVDFPFVGGPPDRVRVDAPADVRWSLAVTALRGATPR